MLLRSSRVYDGPIAERPANHPCVIERFRGYLEESATHSWAYTPCQLWTGGKSRGGDRWSEKAWYGTFNPGGCVRGGVRAHVYAAFIAGIIPDLRIPSGMNLDHCCDQSLCCNPLHLDLVTKLVNQERRMRPWTRPFDAPAWCAVPF